MHRIAPLDNEIQHYAWGSHTALAELLGAAAPSPEPEAELWMGAHPKAPSRVLGDGAEASLPELIRCDPEGLLGPEVARRFAGKLPFLFKVLAADRPLSIQAHPNAAQAAAGFAAENAKGLAADAPERNYRDANHKPELICALTRFRALKGFRRIGDALDRLERLDLPELVERVAAFRADPTRRGLACFFHEQLTLSPAECARIAAAAAERAALLAAEDRAFAWIDILQRHHPGDVGVLAPLLLNTVELAPGQALHLGAGELHSYLGGVGIELMASSDNVLRGGLTPKHVDVDELMRVLTFADGDAQVLESRPRAAGEAVYVTPAREFELSVLRVAEDVSHERAGERGVEILICTAGAGRIVAPSQAAPVPWRRGVTLLVPAAAGPYRVEGVGELYRASVPLA